MTSEMGLEWPVQLSLGLNHFQECTVQVDLLTPEGCMGGIGPLPADVSVD